MARRSVDLIVSLLALVVCSPLIALAALAARLTSPGPAFYRARRVGRGGREFRAYKVRTMVAEAAPSGPRVTGADDPRVTAVGRALRRLKLDELPQLYNVLRGDMSLLGPRPEDPRFVALYDESQRRLLAVRPGLTSPASVAFADEEQLLRGHDVEAAYPELMARKAAIDLAYLERRNVATDLGLVISTLALVGRRLLPYRRDRSTTAVTASTTSSTSESVIRGESGSDTIRR